MIKSNKIIKTLAATSLLTVASFSGNASTGPAIESTNPTVEVVASSRNVVATMCVYESIRGGGPKGFQFEVRHDGRFTCRGPIMFPNEFGGAHVYALVSSYYIYG
ncbi:hypothetical protein [Pseudoalteromonas luteoviolacea]|uniref:Uncharacterized protein n=1 Tax=Pseudoalteromonas luteoviolacea H33 TaxID=1365251 RepID=A0A167CUJ7_9GAMM|nr:hypothetical protein [Pseudoalteromonas luteoviolacea]KZN48085.1 hypothetical protein N476_22370 [Pseudoalteromonas luteoviolacea H33]KZN72253.1 hypothetical protein N477_25325 [Pseudoalteromonas luteoviolacea H33-S]